MKIHFKSKLLNNLPAESIIADVLFIFTNVFLISYITEIVKNNFQLYAVLVLPFEILAVSVASIGFFDKSSSKHTKLYKKFWASSPFNKYAEPAGHGFGVWGASVTFLSVFGLFWMGPILKALFIGQGISLSEDQFEFWAMGLTLINFILLFGALSFSYNLSVNKNAGENKAVKFISALIVMLFLTFLTAIMKESLVLTKPDLTESFYKIIIIITVIMFFPVRLILFLKPPFSFIEVLTFGIAYAVFIKEMFSV